VNFSWLIVSRNVPEDVLTRSKLVATILVITLGAVLFYCANSLYCIVYVYIFKFSLKRDVTKIER